MKQKITTNSFNKRTYFSHAQGVRENQLRSYLAPAFAISMFAITLSMPLLVQATTVGCSGTTGDSHALIVAITDANDSVGGGDTINLSAGCTYTFTAADNWWYGPNALPPIASNIVINGYGSTLAASHVGDPTPITANAFRFFYVSGGFELRAGNLTLNNLTLSGGYAKGGDSKSGGGGAGMGGAIFNQGQLTLTAVTLAGNSAHGGNTSSPGISSSLGGGGGMGEDAYSENGGGFGGYIDSLGGIGGASSSSSGGGGGGFIVGSNGEVGSTQDLGGIGGGLGALGGFSTGSSDGGTGGPGLYGGGAGGDFGIAALGYGYSFSTAGGGGVGAGGGRGGYFGYAGFGGFGGGGGAAGFGGGIGGFGGGGGIAASNTSGGAHAGFGGRSGYGNGGYGGSGAGLGGAIFNHQGTLNLVNVTATNNDAEGGIASSQRGSGLGSAIFNLNGTVTLNFCTVASNSVSGTNGTDASKGAGDGAIYSLAFGNKIQDGTASIASMTIRNSIIYANAGASNGVVNNVVVGTLASNTGNIAQLIYGGGNIVDTAASFGNASSSGPAPLVANPNLGPLQNNGGNTQTMALSAGSPAIDAGVACAGNVPATDQIGNARIWGRAPDLGAYEYASQPGSNDDIFAGDFDTTNNCL